MHTAQSKRFVPIYSEKNMASRKEFSLDVERTEAIYYTNIGNRKSVYRRGNNQKLENDGTHKMGKKRTLGQIIISTETFGFISLLLFPKSRFFSV